MPSFARGALVPVLILLAACSRKPAETPETSAYADPKACAPCHQAIAKSYQQTGMARGFHMATLADAPESPFVHKLSSRRYRFEKRDGNLSLHREDENGENPLSKTIHYVLGSGNHAKSYLHRTPQGRLLEMPVNWYPANGGFLAMSPGYDRADHLDMRRPIGYECMFCHNGYPDIPRATSIDDPVFPANLPEGIDCQRCHGPGRAHATAPARGNILNPKSLTPARQLEVCMQCHLEPTSFPLPNAIVRFEKGIFTYNPAEPLPEFMVHFDHPKGSGYDDKFEIASSAYRLRQSECFLNSPGKLTCTTCHNPHSVTRNFDAACQSCHQNMQAVAGHPAKRDCASCHMPKRRTEDVIHVVMTDHKIQRLPSRKENLLAARTERHEEMGRSSYRGEVALYYPNRLEGATGDLYPAIAQVANQSNLKQGIPRLEAALQKHQPKHPAYYLQMAAALQDADEPGKAIAYYRKALEKDNAYLPALRALGVSQARLHQFAEAVSTLERATTRHPHDSLSWLELARTYRSLQRPAEAAAAAKKAVENEPELIDAQVLLGTILSESGDRAGAEAAFRAALREQPGDAGAHTNLGNLLVARGADKEAEYHLKEAVRCLPSGVAARYNLAVFYANQRRFAEAIPNAREAVALDPRSPNSRDLLGNLYAASRQWKEAANTYRDALKVDPTFPRAQLGLGTALGAQGDFAGARIYLRQAAQSPDPAVRAEAADLLSTLPAIP